MEARTSTSKWDFCHQWDRVTSALSSVKEIEQLGNSAVLIEKTLLGNKTKSAMTSGDCRRMFYPDFCIEAGQTLVLWFNI